MSIFVSSTGSLVRHQTALCEMSKVVVIIVPALYKGKLQYYYIIIQGHCFTYFTTHYYMLHEVFLFHKDRVR